VSRPLPPGKLVSSLRKARKQKSKKRDPLLALDYDSEFVQDEWNRESVARAQEELRKRDKPSPEVQRVWKKVRKLQLATANSPWQNRRKFVADDKYGGSERMLHAARL
jgi:hypothetical protein